MTKAREIRDSFMSLYKKGFFSIFSSDILVKIVAFLGGIILVRILSKEDYGSYTYIFNAVGILSLFGDMGCSSAAMQICSENFSDTKKKEAIIVKSFHYGAFFSIISMILILFSPLFYPFTIGETSAFVSSLCIIPIFNFLQQFFPNLLLINLENKKFSFLNCCNSVIFYVVLLPGAYFWGLSGAAYSHYVIGFCSAILALVICGSHFNLRADTTVFSQSERKGFLKLAFASQLNAMIAFAMIYLDIFALGYFYQDASLLASYKVASTIPSALAFVPQSIMKFAVPHFARNREDIVWVKQNFKRLILGSATFNFCIAAGGIFLAPFILSFLFGEKYRDAVPCFIILMIGFFFYSAFKNISTGIIYTQRKVRVNLVITFLLGVIKVVLNVFFVVWWGAIGAAIATTITHFIGAALAFGYMLIHLKSVSQKH